MTGPPPPPPPGMSGEPYREPGPPQPNWHWVDDLAAMEVRANLGSIRLGYAPLPPSERERTDMPGGFGEAMRFRVAVPNQLRVGMGIDLLLGGLAMWIAWLAGVSGVLLLVVALAVVVLNCCVLQGLTGRSVAKWLNRTQLTFIAQSRYRPDIYETPYFAVPGIGRCAIRLLTQIVFVPVLFRVRQKGTVWSTLADDLNAVVILSPPVRLKRMQDGDQRDYQMLPPWELRLRDRQDRRRYG